MTSYLFDSLSDLFYYASVTEKSVIAQASYSGLVTKLEDKLRFAHLAERTGGIAFRDLKVEDSIEITASYQPRFLTQIFIHLKIVPIETTSVEITIHFFVSQTTKMYGLYIPLLFSLMMLICSAGRYLGLSLWFACFMGVVYLRRIALTKKRVEQQLFEVLLS